MISFITNRNAEAKKNDTGCIMSIICGTIAFVVCFLFSVTSRACSVQDDTVGLDSVANIVESIDSVDIQEIHHNTRTEIVREVHYVPEVYTVRDTVYELYYVPCGNDTIIKEVKQDLTKDQLVMIALGKGMLIVIAIFFLFLLCFFIGCVDISYKKPKKNKSK